ncbi:MAG: ECF transporter S component [Collinsella sp.]
MLAKLEIPLLLAVPAVMAAALLAGVEQAALAMLVVVALVLALFFAGYEASRPGLRQIMPTLVLAALAAAGRILFGPIPDFKPVSAIAIIAGATLGRRNGFMVGALAALTSNFFLGRACGRRGRCMPGARGIRWRCAGVCGCIRPRRWHRAYAGAADLRLCFGFAVRRCDQRLRHHWFVQPLTWAGAVARLATAVPFDITHGLATCVFWPPCTSPGAVALTVSS